MGIREGALPPAFSLLFVETETEDMSDTMRVRFCSSSFISVLSGADIVVGGILIIWSGLMVGVLSRKISARVDNFAKM